MNTIIEYVQTNLSGGIIIAALMAASLLFGWVGRGTYMTWKQVMRDYKIKKVEEENELLKQILADNAGYLRIALRGRITENENSDKE